MADGPRHSDEELLTSQCRAIIEGIDWPCELRTNYSDINLGCKRRMSSGISWVFENEEEAIFLEDDCIPGDSFMGFAETMLERYRNDESVMHIGANNFQFGKTTGDGDYYFSNYAHIWGWASWKRAWQFYDADIAGWPLIKKSSALRKAFNNDGPQHKYWEAIMDKMYSREIDTWDYQWLFAIWKRGAKCIIPSVNLVENIGFDKNATHTRHENENIVALKSGHLESFKAPTSQKINHMADAGFFYYWFGIQKPEVNNLLAKLRKRFGSIKHKITATAL